MYFPHYILSIMKHISFYLCVRVTYFFHFALLGYWSCRHKESMFGICSVGVPPCSFGRTGKFDDQKFDSTYMNDILAQVMLQITSLQISSVQISICRCFPRGNSQIAFTIGLRRDECLEIFATFLSKSPFLSFFYV
jgi:hypothetical protein